MTTPTPDPEKQEPQESNEAQARSGLFDALEHITTGTTSDNQAMGMAMEGGYGGSYAGPGGYYGGDLQDPSKPKFGHVRATDEQVTQPPEAPESDK